MITRITTIQSKAAIEDCMTHAAITGSLHDNFERYRAIRVYGIFEYTYNRQGQTDDCHHFDKDNMMHCMCVVQKHY